MNALYFLEVIDRHGLEFNFGDPWIQFGKQLIVPKCRDFTEEIKNAQRVPTLHQCRDCYKIFLNPHPIVELEVFEQLCKFVSQLPQVTMKVYNEASGPVTNGEKVVIYPSLSQFIKNDPESDYQFLAYMFSTMFRIYKDFLRKYRADETQQVRRHSVTIPNHICKQNNLKSVAGNPHSPIIFTRQSCNNYRENFKFTGINGAFFSERENRYWLKILKHFTPPI